MFNALISLIERRVSTNFFDSSHRLEEAQIEQLAHLATRAPTAYNLQNWRLIAVRSSRHKERLREVADNQAKVCEAAVTFIICGVLPDAAVVSQRLRPLVEAGLMPDAMAMAWQEGAYLKYRDPQIARDEAVRSATLAGATLIYAAEALGLASCPMVGFDARGVASAFGLKSDELPVLLVAVGRAAPGNWPQKPRRPLYEVLEVL